MSITVLDSLKCRYVPLIKHMLRSINDYYTVIHLRIHSKEQVFSTTIFRLTRTSQL